MSADIGSLRLRSFRSPFSGMAGFLLGTLFLAGAIHICTILLVPMLARNDGWSRLAPVAAEGRFAELPVVGPGAVKVAGLDPLFVNAACRLRLGEAPAAIAVAARERFWSLALYDPTGTVIFSLNDRTAVEGRLEMLVVTPAQNAELRQGAPATGDQTVVVEARTEDVVALLRLFAPTSTAQAEARRILAAAECVSAPLEE